MTRNQLMDFTILKNKKKNIYSLISADNFDEVSGILSPPPLPFLAIRRELQFRNSHQTGNLCTNTPTVKG